MMPHCLTCHIHTAKPSTAVQSKQQATRCKLSSLTAFRSIGSHWPSVSKPSREPSNNFVKMCWVCWVVISVSGPFGLTFPWRVARFRALPNMYGHVKANVIWSLAKIRVKPGNQSHGFLVHGFTLGHPRPRPTSSEGVCRFSEIPRGKNGEGVESGCRNLGPRVSGKKVKLQRERRQKFQSASVQSSRVPALVSEGMQLLPSTSKIGVSTGKSTLRALQPLNNKT